MSPRRILTLLGLLATLAFIFPRVEVTGSGAISVRGKTPYDRTVDVRFGPLPREWASVSLSDHYDGTHHTSKFFGGMQTSPNWWFGLMALMCGITVFVLRWI